MRKMKWKIEEKLKKGQTDNKFNWIMPSSYMRLLDSIAFPRSKLNIVKYRSNLELCKMW